MPTGPNLCLYQILSNYFKPHTQEFGLEIHSGEVTRKEPQQWLSILHVWHPYWSLSMHLPNIIKIFQTIKKLWSAQEFGLEIHLGEITTKKKKKKKKKQRKSCLSCMWHSYLTWYMALPYLIKLSQIVWALWPAQDFCFRGDNYINKKVRVLSLARKLPTSPPLHPF